MESALWGQFEGATVGKYRLLRLLGAGGHGGIYEADSLSADSGILHVAVKLLEPTPGREDAQLAEIAGLAGLAHPSLLRTYTPAICTLNNVRLIYIPTELADDSLQSRIPGAPLSIDEIRDAGIALTSALVYLHEQRRPLVHRDVKPANAMRVGARWKLGDFGLIRSITSKKGVRTRNFTGTAEYAPPEAFDGLISPAWDVWSLGISLHEAATGRSPFDFAETPQQLMQAICSDAPRLDEKLPKELRDILKACLDRDPEVRWTSERLLEELEGMETGPSQPFTVPQFGRRQPQRESGAAEPPMQEEAIDDAALIEHTTVSKEGDGDCRTLAEAIRRTAAGGMITMHAGTYSGTATVNRPVEIRGEGEGVRISVIGEDAIVVAADGVRISGLAISSRGEMQRPKHHAITVRSGSAQIDNCDVSCSSMACVAAHAGARVELNGCTIHEGKTAGVLIEHGANAVLDSCHLEANFGPAIHVWGGAEIIVQSCDITNGREAGIVIDKAGAAEIKGTTIHANEGAGIIAHESSTLTITECSLTGNKHAGLSVRSKASVTLTDCELSANMLSGAALSGCSANLLRCRIYDGMSNGIVVSEHADCTLQSCDITSNGFAGIKVSLGGELTAISCNLHAGKRNAATVQDGSRAVFTNCNIQANGQVGVMIEAGGTAQLVDCTLTECGEGGVHCTGSGVMERCRSERGGKPMIECEHGGNAVLRDCTVESNEMPAILVHNRSEAVIERCVVTGNAMPGIAVGESSKALINECIVKSGTQVGVVFWDTAKGIVDRCEIVENALDGIRLMQQSAPTISACRINRNGQFGVHVSGQSAGEIVDCDLTANQSGPAFLDAGCETTSSGNIV